jgi:hypothetical protein
MGPESLPHRSRPALDTVKVALALRALCADESVMSRMDATWEKSRQADRRDLTLRLLKSSETKILPEILTHRVGRRNNTNQPKQ